MGLFDSLKKVATATVAKVATPSSTPPSETPTTTAKEEESVAPAEAQEEEGKSEGGGFLGGIIKKGLSSAMKVVGLAGWRAKQVENLEPNFTSEDPLDHVLVLNKASAAFHGLKNLGIYADITKVTFSHALKVATEDDFVEITMEDREMAGNTLPSDNSSPDPFDFAFDDLLSRECPDLDGNRKPDSVIPYSA